MVDSTQDLKDWFVQYLKHRDMFLKKIESIDEKGDTIHVKYKNQEQKAFIVAHITTFDSVLKELESGEHDDKHQVTLVTLNMKDNLKQLISNWDNLIEHHNFNVFFVNPYATDEKRWIVAPRTHHKITDDKNLKVGLKTLFQSVEEFKR